MKKTLLFIFMCCCMSMHAVEEIVPQEGWSLIQKMEKEGNRDSLAVLHARMAEYYAYRDADSIYYYCQQGLALADHDRLTPYVDLLMSLSGYYNAIGSGRASVDFNLQALHEAERLKADDFFMGSILSSLGVCYRRINMPDSALVCYNRSMEYLEKAGDAALDEFSHLLTSISILYSNNLRFAEAEKYIRQALEKVEKVEDLDTRLYVMNTAGGIFTINGKYEEGRAVMLRSLELARQADSPSAVLQCTSALLGCFQRMGDYKSIDRYVREAEPWLRRLPPASNGVLGFKEMMGMIYTVQGRYRESNEACRYILDYQQENSQTVLPRIYIQMARNYLGLHQYKSAADHYEQAYTELDSLRQSEIDQQMSQFSVKFETQKKELEIARLNEETLLQKNRMMQWGIAGGLAVVFCLVVILYQFYRKRRLQQAAELKAAQRFIDGLEQERSRLSRELHDGVCNDLLGIGLMLQVAEQKPEVKAEVLKNLENIREDVRFISHELNPPKFHDLTLAEVLEDRFRHIFVSDKIRFTFHQDGNPALWKQLPESVSCEVYRIVQELTNNIVRHAEATEVSLSLQISVGQLVLRIENDGKEFVAGQPSHNGIGQDTLKERLTTLGATLDVTAKDGRQLYMLNVPWTVG